ncbi:Rho-GTPase-activating protein 8 [Rhizoctonia solani AG-1 IB]|uniref:Rho-GTPase-activating protein 8 n=1 Tax=Thanatephorus cucumeris (strain AG1-IB / isolate 7/3/14) TaxID=1108050 RepID=M5BN48_THACB|nr:Rho-GTPase-activating protein 8 [Rhizoctonia solani AG-1 IB]
MSTDEPKVAPNVSLPLSFQNSFWTPDYRTGLTVLFDKLEQGIAENAEVVAFIRARVAAERNIAASLINPPLTGSRGTGFDADDGAALLRAFQGLQAESTSQGNAHKNLAQELDSMVADPFDNWAAGYAGRIRDSQHVLLDVYIKNYEDKSVEVNKLKQAYLNKTRLANEAEDDAKFAPHQNLGDAYTSPRLKPTTLSRTGTVSDRILQQMGVSPSRENSGASDAASITTADTSTTEPKLDKGKGRATSPPPEVASPLIMSPVMPTKLEIPAADQPLPPILLAGLALSPAALSALLLQASKELKTTTVKLPFIAEYRDCFTGADFVDFLKSKVPGLGDSVERAEEAARDLTERENLLRRIGELGNAFEDSQAALYQLRPKAFNLEAEIRNSLQPPNSADKPAPSPSLLSPASNVIKRSGTMMNFIQRAVKNVNSPAEPPHIRARNEADAAEHAYRTGIRVLDKQRLGAEEKVEEALKVLNKWEIERLRVVKTVLQQYQAALSSLPNALNASIARSKPLIDAFTPETDATALIERARTGPFRPTAHLFENRQLGEYITDGHFGLDLGKWGAAAWGEGEAAPDAIPSVITALIGALEAKYPSLASDEERRRTWIYDVPLTASHRLREAINDVPSNQDIPSELFEKFDAPVLAATTKLWFLELNPPLGLWETWDELRKIYPSVGAAQTEDRRVEDLQTVLIKLPKVNLLVLDAIIKHLKELVEETLGADEPRDVYVAKLGLSIGRIFMRPKVENELSIQDRHPKLLVVDLIDRYDEILPPTVAKKKREVERRAPTRKRTKPFDQRINRRSAHLQDPRKLLEVQHANQAGRSRSSSNVGQRPPVQSPGSTVHSPGSEAAPPAPPSGFVEPGPPPPRPAFVDPGEPPRPVFAEPKDERPAFAEPKDDESGLAVPQNDGIVIQPPTPIAGPGENPTSPSGEDADETPGSPPRASSPSVPAADAPLSRTPSGTTRGPLRGPRMAAKGPRAPPSSGTPPPTAPTHIQRESRGSVSSMVSNFERPQATANPSDYAPRGRGGRANASAFGRREGQLATRTMASGSEDETVGK